MIEITNKQDCCGCYACYNICPKNAIIMEEDEKGFKYPKINKEKCINCNLCNVACPILKKYNEIKNTPKAYACFNKNDDIRKKSSSGGIFNLIANYILEQNGLVIGAAFNEEFLVEHKIIDNKNDLEQLMGSKYIQSDINDTYKKAKEILDNGKKLLFTGTPCQINGLKSYLNKEYENLYLQDIICHGVPSKNVWKRYLESIKEKKEELLKIEFRNKDLGWKDYSISLKYKNKVYRIKHQDDMYIKLFLNNLSLRDSCYSCKFKTKNRVSDITLADFWGIDNILPDMNDNKGTSLVITNSEKGKKLFDNIKKELIYKETDFEEAIKYNKSMYKSSKEPKKREEFFCEINKGNKLKNIVKRFVTSNNIYNKIIRKIKNIIR